MKYSKAASDPNNQKSSTSPVANSYSPEARCHCGQLVAKLSVNGIELKCKRCKRLIHLQLSNLSGPQKIFLGTLKVLSAG